LLKSFFTTLGLLCFVNFQAYAEKVYLLSNHTNVGDHNQALGILTAFEKLSQQRIPFEDIDTKTATSSEIKDKVEKDLLHEKVIIVGAGEGGVNGIAEVSKEPNLTICLTCHRFLDQFKDKNLLEKVDFIALPKHVAPDLKADLGSKLIETIGVAHNRRPDMETYDEWKKDLPPADIYFGVVLGGDVLTPTKKIEFFTEEEASNLANYVTSKINELATRGLKGCVLVLNGPRTGKFDANKKEIMTAHREGKSDHVTEFFAKKFADNDIEYKVFDFQYNSPENKKWIAPYNAFDLVLGAVRTTKGKMIVPGGSALAISEIVDTQPYDSIDTMPPGKALVYDNNAMDEIDKAYVQSELDAGRISVLENYQEIKAPEAKEPESEAVESHPSAAKIIARKLVEFL